MIRYELLLQTVCLQYAHVGTVDNHGNTEIMETVIFVLSSAVNAMILPKFRVFLPKMP